MIEINLIKNDYPEFETVKSIRKSVFIIEQGIDEKEEFDRFDNDNKTDYLLLYFDKKPVATARLVYNDNKFKIGRIAVLKEFRGEHLGDSIVRVIISKAFDRGAEIVYVDAQNYAVPFYQRFGFTVIGDEIIDRGLPHMPMSLERGNYSACKCKKK